jgi:hypothetical protein
MLSILSIAAAGFLLFLPTRVFNATAIFFVIFVFIYCLAYSMASFFLTATILFHS